MARYTTTVSRELAELLAEHFAPNGTLGIWPAGTEDTRTVAFTDAQVRHLESLDEEHDGHVDTDGTMWIGGTAYPLEVVHNA